MKIRNTILVLLCSAMSCIGFAQVSFTYQVTNATCSSNGSIVVNATGGTGTLNYQLTGTCLNLPLVQQSPSFNNLAPCSYQLTVTDGASGASASQTVVVGGNYQSPDISLFCGSCSIETQLTGGLGPFAYSISSVGLSGPFTNNSPASNPSFDNILSGTNYWVKVTDACGNVSVETCQTGEGSLADFNYEVGADGNLHTISIIGGNGNLEYTLSSSVGTFSNQTGVFSPAQWGCNMTLTLSDGCTSLTKSVVIRPKILSICSNFAEGTATLENVIYGVPPYTFRYIFPDNSTVINSPTNELTGLPINSNFYLFQVVDACGNGSDGIFKQKKYPVFEQAPPADCNGNSISLFTPESGCGGGFDADSWPFEVTCQTCSPIVTQQVNGAGIPITFTGNAPGNWELAIEDGCEDKMVCRDSVILLLEKRCDSIYATLIDRFTCDNGAVSDRPLSAANGLFTLLDANENVVSTNMTGEFHVPDSGDYKVLLNIQGCGSYEASTSVGHWQPIEPEMSIYIYNAILANQCKTVYQLIISREDGPYLLTGGPNNITMLLDENDLTGSCQQYSITGLLPGSYQLSEIDKCGFRMLDLPAPDYNLVAEPFGNCPGSGTITVSGAQNLAQWQAWGESNNIDISWPNSITDNYALDAPTNGALTAQSGSPFTFVNVAAGEHTVYLYTLNSQCAIDTAIVFVPEADTLAFDVSSGILCDGASTTTLHFEVLSGKPPYVIEQVDCSNPAQVIATHQLSDDSFALPGFGIGDYCFRLIDSCITSLDHQFSVQYFQDDIDVAFNCDNTFSLSVDSLNANYSWVDENGNEVGNTHRITLPNTGLVASFSVFVDIGECIIERKITVPATEIIPTIEIQGASFFCAGETVELTAVASAASLLWNNAAISTTITTSMPGTYAATVTNGFGCTATDSFSLSLDLPLVEIEIMSGGNGFGLNCFQDSNGVLRANPIIGIPPFTYEWSNQDTTESISNLKTGAFTVTVTDGIGCKDTTSIALTEPDLFVPSVYFESPRCFGVDDGYVEVPSWSGGAGDVTVQLSNSSLKYAPVVFDNLPADSYLLEIMDGNGCKVDTSIQFEAPQELFLELGDDLTIDLGDSILLDPQVSFSPVDSFAWQAKDATAMVEFSEWVRPLETTFYALKVWDENGCELEDRLNVRVIKELDVFVPNAFSPNGDGSNDLITVFANTSAITQINSFQIFNRYGGKVFDRTNFQPNMEQLGWDGKFEGQMQKPAVFAWRAEVAYIDGRVEYLFGDLVLVR